MKKILVLAPHTDDGECGCGGSIAKFVEEGDDVYYATFSSAKKSIPKEFPQNITEKEFKKATQTLGLSKDNIILFDYEVRDFPAVRQNILEDMVKLNKDITPDLIFMPSLNDTHQDHNVIASEGFRAFKRTSILGYEIPWNNLTFNTNVFIFLTDKQIKKKLMALDCYHSQKMRMQGGTVFFEDLAKVRGVQIGAKYAECFETIRWVIT